MHHPAQRLEELVQIWEDGSLFAEAAEAMGIFTPVKDRRDWREFRDHLFRSSPEDEDQFFDYRMNGSVYGSGVPMEIFFWFHRARRVFQIPNRTLVKLAEMDVSDVRFHDLHWPFGSIVMVFDEPMDTGIGTFDTLMATYYPSGEHNPGQPWADLHFIDAKLGDCFLTPALRAEFDRVRLGTRAPALKKWLKRSQRRLDRSFLPNFIWSSEEEMARLLRDDPKSPAVDPENPIFRDGARLMTAFLVYLDAIPVEAARPVIPSVGAPGGTPRRGPRAPTQRIFDGSQVFCIGHEHEIGPVSQGRARTRGGEPAYELSYHKRRAHWRRPPGTPPDHPKTIRVPREGDHIEVRPDKEIPGVVVHAGSLSKVK